MKTIIHWLIAIFIICPLCVSAQERHSDMEDDLPDCLRNEEYFGDEYESLLIRTLMPYNQDFKEDLTYGRVWGMFVKPSYAPESCFYCSTYDEEPSLVLCIPDLNIWSASQDIMFPKKTIREKATDGSSRKVTKRVSSGVKWENVKVKTKVKRISLKITDEQKKAISRLFAVTINTATSFIRSNEMYFTFVDENGKKSLMTNSGEDGTTSMLFYNGRAASFWSAPKGSKRERLNKVIDKIVDAISQNDASVIENEMSEIKALTNEFRELLPDWGKDFFDNYEYI